MANWNESEFTLQAQDIARKHVLTKTSINLLSEKLARDQSLNPEQIRTLVRLANVATFQEIFKNKTDGDKMVEFDVGQPEEVIRKIVNEESAEPQTANINNDKLAFEIPDIMRDVRNNVYSITFGEEKLAEEVITPSKLKPDLAILNMRKLADELTIEKCNLDRRWEDNINHLNLHFKKVYTTDFSEFEKNALAEYGENAFVEIDALKTLLKITTNSLSTEKIAHLRENVLTTVTKESSLLGETISIRNRYSTILKTLDWLDKELN